MKAWMMTYTEKIIMLVELGKAGIISPPCLTRRTIEYEMGAAPSRIEDAALLLKDWNLR
jgi:hypothetical protein